jgi:hypothetical protein
MLAGLRQARGARRLELTGWTAAPDCIPADHHHAENSHDRDCAAAGGCDRAPIPAGA